MLVSNKVNIWREIVEDGAGFADEDSRAGTQRLLTRWLSSRPLRRADEMRRACDARLSRRGSKFTRAVESLLDGAAAASGFPEMRITIVSRRISARPAAHGRRGREGVARARARSSRGVATTWCTSRALVSPTCRGERSPAAFTHVRVRGYDTPASLPLLEVARSDLLVARFAGCLPKRSDVIVTNTFWLPMLLRNASRGQVYVHVARFPKGQMRYYSHCARLQAPSRAVAEAVKQQAPELASKVTAIPYPRPEPIDASTPPPLQSRPATILYVGRVHPEKGVHLLVEAFTRLPRALPVSWKLRIVGPWESHLGGGGEAYRDQLLQPGERGADAVQLHGSIFEARELEREFRSARVFVYPSLAETGETFGLAPLEAMTHGCAVVVSNLGCFHDFVIDDETGFIFDHRAEGAGSSARAEAGRTARQ